MSARFWRRAAGDVSMPTHSQKRFPARTVAEAVIASPFLHDDSARDADDVVLALPISSMTLFNDDAGDATLHAQSWVFTLPVRSSRRRPSGRAHRPNGR
jgi:hypothetical protein